MFRCRAGAPSPETSALLAGAAVDRATHAAIDRGALFPWLAGKTGQPGYVEHCQAVRLDENGHADTEINCPESTCVELDAALHRNVGVGAAAVTTWLATRRRGRQ
ncbi:hypothetical protein ACFY15_36120 [Streptomyces sp. NPDC001373]|uniref:hypothetical protein n=1 Tax=Streptomyces sp. NPDC001373 TaxID=3364565 RepID=UPI0036BE7669